MTIEGITGVESARLDEEATSRIHPSGPFPAIRPIQCASWCTEGDGHTNAAARADQSCWGQSHYVELSLQEVAVEFSKNAAGHTIWPSIIGPNAYCGHSQIPCVYLHFILQEHGADRQVDDSCKLTPAEARQLAAHLIEVADEIEALQ